MLPPMTRAAIILATGGSLLFLLWLEISQESHDHAERPYLTAAVSCLLAIRFSPWQGRGSEAMAATTSR